MARNLIEILIRSKKEGKGFQEINKELQNAAKESQKAGKDFLGLGTSWQPVKLFLYPLPDNKRRSAK